MSEPIITNEPDGQGRPSIADEQYWKWLEEMRPFLEDGYSLRYAIDRLGLTKHKDSIYKKCREDKEFSDKVETLQALSGEIANLIGVKSLKSILKKIVETNGDYFMGKEEVSVWKTMAEKHRTSQPFFSNRVENAEAKDDEFGKVLTIPKIEYIVPTGTDANTPPTNPIQPDPPTT